MATKLAIFAATAFAMALGMSAARAADIVTIDPDRDGDASNSIEVAAFDWLPDNALADEAVPLSAGLEFDLFAQAALGSFVDANGDAILGTGLGSDYEITFELGFKEVVTSLTALGGDASAVATFAEAGDQSASFFTIYWDDNAATFSDPQTGEGYNEGTILLTGFITDSGSVFLVTDGTPDELLDQSADGDQQAGLLTVEGTGSATVEVDVDEASIDTLFFLDLITALLVDLEFNLAVPFEQVDPTGPATATDGVVGHFPEIDLAAGNGAAGASCGTPAAPDCDFLFQQDASNSFQAQQVPEPGTLALFGLGMLGIALFAGLGRRERAA